MLILSTPGCGSLSASRFALPSTRFQGGPLVSGMTATVTVRQADAGHRNWLDRMRGNVADQVAGLFASPPPRPNCLPVMTTQLAPSESIPAEVAPEAKSPAQIVPGLAPGMDQSPRDQ